MAKEITEKINVDWKTTHTDEWNAYIKALARLASTYVSWIRVRLAKKAYEKYSDATIRKLVLKYGKEIEKLDADRVRDFGWLATSPEMPYTLNDSCLNNAGKYEQAILFLFDTDLTKKEEEQDKEDE